LATAAPFAMVLAFTGYARTKLALLSEVGSRDSCPLTVEVSITLQKPTTPSSWGRRIAVLCKNGFELVELSESVPLVVVTRPTC